MRCTHDRASKLETTKGFSVFASLLEMQENSVSHDSIIRASMSKHQIFLENMQPPPLEKHEEASEETIPPPEMAVSMSKKRSRLPRKAEAEEFGSFISVLSRLLCRIPAILLFLVLVFLWSSSTTVISGNIFHLCVSSRKLNNLYCLSAGTHPNFEIPVSIVHNNTTVDDFVENPVRISDNITGHGRDGEVAHAVKIVEEQIRELRSRPANGKSDSGDCNGKGVFVYDLPPKFNKEILSKCHDIVPWIDFCKYFNNEGLGEPIMDLGKGWYKTHQYSLEPIFHSRVLRHPCRVYDQNEAKLFYVPFYGGLDVLRWHFKKNVSGDVKDSLGLELMRWLESQPPWNRNSGKDHVFVLGKISWDFRRNNGTSWGTRLLEFDQMQNPLKLLIERQPWHINDIGIPHPTNFHPHSDDDVMQWQLKIMKSDRKSLVSFAGAARPGAPENIRSVLIKQCVSADTQKLCRFLDCDSGVCGRPESVVNLFMESEFCLQPPGDSPTRKSVFDSLVAGCIPVLFDPFTAYYQYPWHLPEDHTRYSVFIDQEEVRSMEVNVVERLMKVSVREREDMRRYIVYELLPGLLYGDSSSEFDKFQDAFSITMNNLLQRIS